MKTPKPRGIVTVEPAQFEGKTVYRVLESERGGYGFYPTEAEAEEHAEQLRNQKVAGKMTWSDFKKVEGIKDSIFDDEATEADDNE